MQDTTLFQNVYTKDDLLFFYKQIDQLVNALFSGTGGFAEKAQEVLGNETQKNVTEYLVSQKVDLKNLVEVQAKLKEIKKLGDSLPVVSFIVAKEPTRNLTKTICSWFLRRMKRRVLLDFSLEHSLVAGAIVSFGGKYKNYSLEKKINEYFEKKPQNHAEEINNVELRGSSSA